MYYSPCHWERVHLHRAGGGPQGNIHIMFWPWATYPDSFRSHLNPSVICIADVYHCHYVSSLLHNLLFPACHLQLILSFVILRFIMWESIYHECVCVWLWSPLWCVYDPDHHCGVCVCLITTVVCVCAWSPLWCVCVPDYHCDVCMTLITTVVCVCAWSPLWCGYDPDHHCGVCVTLITTVVCVWAWSPLESFWRSVKVRCSDVQALAGGSRVRMQGKTCQGYGFNLHRMDGGMLTQC
jgi:hypothetical protein